MRLRSPSSPIDMPSSSMRPRELPALEVEERTPSLVGVVPPEPEGRFRVATEVAVRGQVGVPLPSLLLAELPGDRRHFEPQVIARALTSSFAPRSVTPRLSPSSIRQARPSLEVLEKPGALRGIQAWRVVHPFEQAERDPLRQGRQWPAIYPHAHLR